MKIELGAPAASQVQVERNTKQVSNGNVAGNQSVSNDRTTLQSDSAGVQSLVKQAMSLPDVRQDKVDAIRQALNNGEYKIDPQKIAAGIVAESDH